MKNESDSILFTKLPTEEEMKEIAKEIKTINLATTKKQNQNLFNVIEELIDIINELDIELCTVLNNNQIQVTGKLTGERYEQIMDYVIKIEEDLKTKNHIKNTVEKERSDKIDTERKNFKP